MAKETLLLADNDPEFLKMLSPKLIDAGYIVIWAENPIQARSALTDKGIDLAILDLRLEDNHDKGDVSGLTIARDVARAVPKIIISDYASLDDVRDDLGLSVVDGLPSVVRFVKKKQGVEAILKAIEEGLALTPHFQKAVNDLTVKLGDYYSDARAEARQYGRMSLAASIIGIGVILYAGVLGLQEKIAIALSTAVAGMIIEAMSVFAFRRSDVANLRRDRYHFELLGLRQFEILLAACGTLKADKEQRGKEKVIAAATQLWLAKGSDERPLAQSAPGIAVGFGEGEVHDPANPAR
jgi:CheY-like chemotaxis protein